MLEADVADVASHICLGLLSTWDAIKTLEFAASIPKLDGMRSDFVPMTTALESTEFSSTGP